MRIGSETSTSSMSNAYATDAKRKTQKTKLSDFSVFINGAWSSLPMKVVPVRACVPPVLKTWTYYSKCMQLSWQLCFVRDFDFLVRFVARAVQKKTKNDTGLWAGNASLLRHIIYMGLDSGRCRFSYRDTGFPSKDYNLKLLIKTNCYDYLL